MKSKNHVYVNNIDSLIESTSLDQVLAHYGLPLTQPGASEHRMGCVFNEECKESDYGNLSVKLDAAKRVFCHRCETRGNLLTLLHGLETGRPPTGGKVRGQEFKDAANLLREINGGSGSGGTEPVAQADRSAKPSRSSIDSKLEVKTKPVERLNVPLVKHEKVAARLLADLYQDLVVDPAEMSPLAASYVRERAWLTPEVMRHWGIGWIHGNGRSLFRKNYLVYTHRNIRGHVVSYSGRDLNFEEKRRKWSAESESKKPYKHRFVSGFQRGLELYGGVASRVEDPKVRESLAEYGLVIVEGMNDVVRLDCLGVAAVGLCSNKATAFQIERIIRFANMAGGEVLLLPDCDAEGEMGFKDLLWELSGRGVNVRLGMSSSMFNGKFAGKQPEDLDEDDWEVIRENLAAN